MRTLIKAWENFVSEEEFDHSDVRPLTLMAWERCKRAGTDPRSVRVVLLSDEELRQKQEANADLIRAASPYMQHLESIVKDIPYIIALLDAQAWVIHAYEQDFGGRERGMCAGASWAEENLGNNAGGTCLALGEPVVVHGVEHYVQEIHRASCLGVPIRQNGRIIGALDFSVFNEDADPSVMHLLDACVKSIETTFDLWAGTPTDEPVIKPTVLSMLAHDLKNPLSVISAQIQLGMATGDDKHYKDSLKAIKAMADRLNLLSLSFGKNTVWVDDLMTQVLRSVEPRCLLGKVELVYSLQSKACVEVNEDLLTRVLHNLISNALDEMESGGRLRLWTEMRDQALVIGVKDTGSGIPEGIRSHVFEPFVTDKKKGLGMGLYMVYDTVVNQWNGKVWYDSSPQGTTFYLEIPVRAPGFNKPSAMACN